MDRTNEPQEQARDTGTQEAKVVRPGARKSRFGLGSLIVGGAIVLGFAVGSATIGSWAQSGSSLNSDTYRQLNLLGEVFEQVRAQYVEDVTDQELIEAAVNGMLTSLDPHSSYLTAKSFDDMRVQTRGEFGGLGIEVTMENGFVKVVSPIDDTPAAAAGLEPGDYITHLDGEAVLGLTLSEAVEKMRGKVGTAIALTIRRADVAEPFDVELTRAVITIKSVRSRAIGDIGYIRITTFNEQTTSGLHAAIASLKEELGDELHGYVIDLRNNPGGLLQEAIDVSDTFLEQGEIVSTRGRSLDDSSRSNAQPGDNTDGAPVVVLINRGSASASEIVAGALQDHGRAIVLGTQSFGKGSVQTIIPLPGHGAMRLTTARYYTPSGRSIQAKGVTPDIIVEAAKIEKLAQRLNRREADLRGRLDNSDTSTESETTEPKPEAAPAVSSETEIPKAEVEGVVEEVEDYQLARAIDLLRGIFLYNKKVPN
jgi:carboxyl-terminal processing protease